MSVTQSDAEIKSIFNDAVAESFWPVAQQCSRW